MAKADPLKSLGARTERQAMRKFIGRLVSEYNGTQNAEALYVVQRFATYLNSRVSRYDKRAGGLGKK